MVMIRAILRPERVQDVIEGLLDAGYPALTRINVAGRGQQRGIKVGEVMYDELPKEMLLVVVPESEKEIVLRVMLKLGKTPPSGVYGDGKIFITPVEETYTISSGFKEE
ncbi:P-II family nitrogen regulator [Sediminispirochaeta smaragdinae]|uniref:Nitrogen regulatory protein P-II n=1 Tax=Sediminispirochaeta smaragdinae (strain DSM 11293 / JCM 15392 / SEBR 4228) TaxID=573413 RepID=E1R3Y8_SEDSS|nr:P-II family nitrogen regulator [Sediminispirochaeta smaragdinae]ADK82109.1 nitrogen regulatory protein P-II [Sediminispirochaeta smaragdinae DSM 11293]